MEAKLHAAGVHLFQVSDKGKVTHITNPNQRRTVEDTTNENSSPGTNGTSQGIFQEQTDTLPTAAPSEPTTPAKGMVVECSGVECIFEFRLFRYKGSKYFSSSQEDQEEQQKRETTEDLRVSNEQPPSNATNGSISNEFHAPPQPNATNTIPPTDLEVRPCVPQPPSLDTPKTSSDKNSAVNDDLSRNGSGHVEPKRHSLDSSTEMDNATFDVPPADDRRKLDHLASVGSESSVSGQPPYQRGESRQQLLQENH